MTRRLIVRVDLVDHDSADWLTALAQVRHDIYHLPAYVEFASRHHDRGKAALAVVNEADGYLLVPLIIREIPARIASPGRAEYDATSPRGYPGPICALPSAPAAAEEFWIRAVNALAHELGHRGVISLFSRLHPLFDVPDAALQQAGALVDHGDSVFVDLTLSDEALGRQTRHGHRQDISKALRRGYVARMDEDWIQFETFVTVFRESMNRVEATPYWRLTRDYFVDLREALGSHLHLCVVQLGDEVTSAALITEIDGIVEYHLAGTLDAHVRASPSKVLVDYVRSWAKARGNTVLHLTGSLSRGDSLSHFKAGFSPLQRPVRSWRLVSDVAAYQTLVDRWGRVNGVAPEPITGFFPAYRKPGLAVP